MAELHMLTIMAFNNFFYFFKLKLFMLNMQNTGNTHAVQLV